MLGPEVGVDADEDGTGEWATAAEVDFTAASVDSVLAVAAAAVATAAAAVGVMGVPAVYVAVPEEEAGPDACVVVCRAPGLCGCCLKTGS